jgi:hypothetical protein
VNLDFALAIGKSGGWSVATLLVLTVEVFFFFLAGFCKLEALRVFHDRRPLAEMNEDYDAFAEGDFSAGMGTALAGSME